MKPSNRKSEIANEGKEIIIVPIAITDTLGNLDLVVEALQLAGGDRKKAVLHGNLGDSRTQGRKSEIANEIRLATLILLLKPSNLPVLIGKTAYATRPSKRDLF